MMRKKIISLTKVLCKEYFKNLPVSKKNKKNIIFWLVIAFNFCLAILSQKIINFMQRYGIETLFLDVLFFIMNMVIMFQASLVCTNVFYFSKDLKYILPYPIKPIELLISKFNTMLSITYVIEIMLFAVPLIIYGLMVTSSILFYFWLIIILIIFPIFIVTIVSLLMLIFMQFCKFIKNKDISQIIITIAILTVITLFEYFTIQRAFTNADNVISNDNNIEQNVEIDNTNQKITEKTEINNKIKEINKYYLIINPSIKLLENEIGFIDDLSQIIKIIVIELVFFAIFICIGSKVYLKSILKNISRISEKQHRKNNKKNKYKKTNKNVIYIINEFKQLIKNPPFLFQCIFPLIITSVISVILINILFPTIIYTAKESLMNEQINIQFDLQIIVIILSIIQLNFVFSNISLTAITRKGKNAVLIKYIPLDLYKQFLFMNIPQIIFNNIPIISILLVIKHFVPEISWIYMIVLFILANILNIINSFLMLIVDFKRPNLNWDNETAAIKENGNKIFQYITTIIIILILIYFKTIFEKINLNLSIIIINIILLLILFLINIYIKLNINKLFKKIN